MCLTEPHCGTDLGMIRTRATPNDDGSYAIEGTKIWITFGEHDLTDSIIHFVLARVPGAEPGTKGLSMFIVPKYLVEADGSLGARNDVELVSIRLTDERFYHIDTCFCPLTDGFLMYHPPAFDYDSRIAIESRIPPHKRIIVDTFDAGHFACNAINIDDRVILHRASEPLKARLMLAGFKVHEVELTEFLKAGGSAKCLSLKLTEPVNRR